jgi:hypothetical protein
MRQVAWLFRTSEPSFAQSANQVPGIGRKVVRNSDRWARARRSQPPPYPASPSERFKQPGGSPGPVDHGLNSVFSFFFTGTPLICTYSGKPFLYGG